MPFGCEFFGARRREMGGLCYQIRDLLSDLRTVSGGGMTDWA